MSVLAWIGLVYLYVGGIITLISIPSLVSDQKPRRFTSGMAVGSMAVGVLSVLAIFAVWLSSGLGVTTPAFVVLLAIQAWNVFDTLRHADSGYIKYTLTRGVIVATLTVVEVVAISLLAFA